MAEKHNHTHDTRAARLNARSAKALYLHLPFCASKCVYCDFASWPTACEDPLMDSYADALVRHSEELIDAGLLEHTSSAYIGGGTPSLLGKRLSSLVSHLSSSIESLVEFSTEANPESLSDELIEELSLSGLTRISIGIQSLDDKELAALGRIHTANRGLTRLRNAVSLGLDVSADLMCAIPEQTDASWEKSVSQVIESGVQHVSIYPLQIEEGTELARSLAGKEAAWNDPDIQAKRMLFASELLYQAGFERYEVASYARPHKSCKHNLSYWTAQPYIGLGTSAASMLTAQGYERLRSRAQKLSPLERDVARVRLVCQSSAAEYAQAQSIAELDFECEFLNEREVVAEDLMLCARTQKGIDVELLADAQTILDPSQLNACLEALIDAAYLEKKGSSLVPTERGWLLGNELFGSLWELAYEH